MGLGTKPPLCTERSLLSLHFYPVDKCKSTLLNVIIPPIYAWSAGPFVFAFETPCSLALRSRKLSVGKISTRSPFLHCCNGNINNFEWISFPAQVIWSSVLLTEVSQHHFHSQGIVSKQEGKATDQEWRISYTYLLNSWGDSKTAGKNQDELNQKLLSEDIS